MLNRRETMLLVAGGAAAMAAGTGPAAAAGEMTEFVQVNMWDRGVDALAAFDMTDRVMLGTPGAAMKDLAPMGFTLNKHVIPHGTVKFVATNTSSDFEHEMLVLPISDVTSALPYNTETERLDEDAAGSLGEIPETAPGETGTVTIDLAPGLYMLACNIANHYAMGMWTLITVI